MPGHVEPPTPQSALLHTELQDIMDELCAVKRAGTEPQRNEVRSRIQIALVENAPDLHSGSDSKRRPCPVVEAKEVKDRNTEECVYFNYALHRLVGAASLQSNIEHEVVAEFEPTARST